jgi:hypothetical protein
MASPNSRRVISFGSPNHSSDADGLSLTDDSSLREINYRRTDLESKLQVGADVRKRLREEETILKDRVAQLTAESERVAADLESRNEQLLKINDELQDELSLVNVDIPYLQSQLDKLREAERRTSRDFATILLQTCTELEILTEGENLDVLPTKLSQLVDMLNYPAPSPGESENITDLRRRIALYEQACQSQNAQTQQQISRLAKEVARLEEIASETEAVMNVVQQVGGDRSQLTRHGERYHYKGISFNIQKSKGNLMVVDDITNPKLLRSFIMDVEQRSLSGSLRKSE